MNVSTQLNEYQIPVIVIQLPSGFLNASNATQIQEELTQIIKETNRSVLLDMSLITFIDSMGLSVLVSVFRICRNLGLLFKLCSFQSQTKMVLSITGMDTLFSSYASVQEALSQFTPAEVSQVENLL
jgi:anti-sigma B factor antagonist